MPNYIGFSTIAANKPKTTNPPPGKYGGPGSVTNTLVSGKKFRMTDQALVIQDFLNAINIKQGQKVGQPEYGSRLWDFIFEPNDTTTQEEVETELRRIISQDPRLQVGTVRVYPQDNGILVELQLAVYPYNQVEMLAVFFNSNTGVASV